MKFSNIVTVAIQRTKIVTAGAMIVIVTGEETIGIVSADTTIVMVTGGQTALAATATSTASRCDAMSHKMARKAVFCMRRTQPPLATKGGQAQAAAVHTNPDRAVYQR